MSEGESGESVVLGVGVWVRCVCGLGVYVYGSWVCMMVMVG